LKTVGDIWKEFIPEEQAMKDFKRFGFYRLDTLHTKNGKVLPSTSLLAINTQSCYNFNFALFNETDDSADQLKWLRVQLSDLENQNRKAIILGHVPPGEYGCIRKWSVRYNALMERYQHIVRFASFGHDHRELFDVTRSLTSGKPIGVNYIAGSLGAYMKVHPSVRYYKLDYKEVLPRSMVSYNLHLEQANHGDLDMKVLKVLPEGFGMDSLSPSEHAALSERLNQDERLAIDYLK